MKLSRLLLVAGLLGVSVMNSCYALPTAAHRTTTKISIDNRTDDNFLFKSAHSNPGTRITAKQHAISNSFTHDAFAVTKSSHIKGTPPSGTFIYANPTGSYQCEFAFGSNGVSLIKSDKHCKVVDQHQRRSAGVTIGWSATIVVSP